jgi:predicted NAD/FAD-dependent oxidoreductase
VVRSLALNTPYGDRGWDAIVAWCDRVSPKGDRFREFLDRLLTADVSQVWTDTVHQVDRAGHLQEVADRAPRYTAADGMNAIVMCSTSPQIQLGGNRRRALRTVGRKRLAQRNLINE